MIDTFGTGSLVSDQRNFNTNCIDRPEGIKKLFPNLVACDGEGIDYEKTVYCGIFELVENDLWFGMHFTFDNDQRLKIKIFYSDGEQLTARTVLEKLEEVLFDKDGLYS